MLVFVTLILTPEILFGYNFLNKTITSATEKVVLNSVWNIKGTVMPISSEKDRKLEEKIQSLLMHYLHQIEEMFFHTRTYRNPDLDIDDIGIALNIPTSHINFIFKYHCNESFTEYKKVVRIHDATKLLEAGYLNDHKVETFSAEVGF
jgi:YesN/AraC family two-component response regulator